MLYCARFATLNWYLLLKQEENGGPLKKVDYILYWDRRNLRIEAASKYQKQLSAINFVMA